MSQLPSALTDEQLLRVADRLTREAIDERLRLLGSVDDVVNRCIDELTRMRSVLPPVGGGDSVSASMSTSGSTTRMNGLSTDASTASVVAESSEKARGKEKEREAAAVDTSDSDSSSAS